MGKLYGWRSASEFLCKVRSARETSEQSECADSAFYNKQVSQRKYFFKNHSLMRNAKSYWFGRTRGGETFENIQEKDIM